METEITLLNSSEKKKSNDIDIDAEENIFDEIHVKRTFSDIEDTIVYEPESPVLSKKAHLSIKKLKQPFRSPLKVNNSITKPSNTIKKDCDTPKTQEKVSVEGDENCKPSTAFETVTPCTTLTSKTPVKKAVFRSPLVSSKNMTDPKMCELYKKKLELERKIWEVDERIKTIETAYLNN